MHSELDAIISDTSCFILLDKISEMELLRRCFRQVFTTKQVANEFGYALPDWVIVEEVLDKYMLENLATSADLGEASVVALSLEKPNCIAVIDDEKGRKLANAFNIKYTGTLGVLALAKTIGVVPVLRPILEKVKMTNFRMSDHLIEIVLKSVGES